MLGLLRLAGVRADPLTSGGVLLTRGRPPRVPVRAESGVLLLRQPQARAQWFGLERLLAHHHITEHVAAILRLYQVNCVLDVGANRGQYAKSLRRAGYRGWIHSFEPVPGVFEALAAAAAADPLWKAHRMALGREDGELEMHVVPGTMSSFLPSTDFGAARYARLQDSVAEKADVRRLDGLLDSLLAGIEDPRPYLKMDTQGFDLEAFVGLGSRCNDFVGMQSEVAMVTIYDGMPRLPESLAAYEQAGFEVTAFYPVSRDMTTARVVEFDCVMVRPDAVLPSWPSADARRGS